MATRTEHVHVVKDESVLGGEPIITGTRTPVCAVFDASGRGLVEREGPDPVLWPCRVAGVDSPRGDQSQYPGEPLAVRDCAG